MRKIKEIEIVYSQSHMGYKIVNMEDLEKITISNPEIEEEQKE